MITSLSKKGQMMETKEAKGTAQTLMRSPPLSIHQDWEGKVSKTFESTVSLCGQGQRSEGEFV